jgi:hypothetical protein
VSCVGRSSVVEEEEEGRGRRRIQLGMDVMAQIGGLVADHGREAEVVNPTFIREGKLINICPLSSRLGEPLTSQDILWRCYKVTVTSRRLGLRDTPSAGRPPLVFVRNGYLPCL